MASLTLTSRAEALFASNLSALSPPTATKVAAAISDALMSYGGSHGCACEVAAAYGEHPETAAPRMRWARALIEAIYSLGAVAHGASPALWTSPAVL
jgi:hypothetical protein